MKQPTKAAIKHFRKLAALAHERELVKALEKVLTEFDRWKKGEIDPFKLNAKIHEHHDGTARDLYKFYVYAKPEVAVSQAIVDGILNEDDVDERYLHFLERLIELYRE